MLDEPASHQHALAELVLPVPLPNLRGLRLEVKRLLSLARTDQVKRFLIMFAQAAPRLRSRLHSLLTDILQ